MCQAQALPKAQRKSSVWGKEEGSQCVSVYRRGSQSVPVGALLHVEMMQLELYRIIINCLCQTLTSFPPYMMYTHQTTLCVAVDTGWEGKQEGKGEEGPEYQGASAPVKEANGSEKSGPTPLLQ